MKTCHRFTRIRAGHERDIQGLLNHAERHPNQVSGKVSAKRAIGAKHAMARALSRHFERCRECG
ncbi:MULTISPECIES: hypothetical protein [Streptomyces]|uniref:Uncharacterized protein n=1 Tax=Streptomyces tsukubensis (strain DSM 42081 / NBRC 108919 / NRRL 18488 / 9993) TaxID=1114943 RepID=I2N847_STRT9|nr:MULTISPECIES: hypothetical protein [Streptomyces]AZK97083.1 hypothetical protein B7R87_26860 [Streptomyces tsukubensis]EIF93194.1 hypothetical protein [Streptomyces tsukubensis NRRL18488]MYS66471.1 hypothetical protein [Streptomyces sp. SID5473]QKM66946.1 hypothetical protein STSU_006910 [Streptomyces tsukubensis NRRL18488]TAI41577.1 hypothetical protein EWI31_27540 [Streptomyces tsukubensis]